MNRLAKIGVALATTLVAIQLVPVDRSNPPAEAEIPASPEVRTVLQRACYDCHSNSTKWPWYSYVAPVSWLVADHVHEGRRELNFTAWNLYPPEKQSKKLREVGEEVKEGKMPMESYVLMHGEAKLSDADKQLLLDWSQSAGGPAPEGEEHEAH